MSHKTIVNTSGQPLEISLNTRRGDCPSNDGPTTESVTIHNGDSFTFNYGDNHNPFLNGLSIAVSERGSKLDDTLNTNSTITIGRDLAAFGSN